jgi:hypothetical protein
MTTFELLKQQNPELAGLIEIANENQLRRISSAIAHSIVEHSALSQPLITKALQHLNTPPYSNVELRELVQKIAEQLDEEYFNLQDLCEDGKATKAQVSVAFTKARAATAVASALGEIAFNAAAETAYEANAGDDGSKNLTEIAKKILTI